MGKVSILLYIPCETPYVLSIDCLRNMAIVLDGDTTPQPSGTLLNQGFGRPWSLPDPLLVRPKEVSSRFGSSTTV
jgi:hypothetical protein